MDMIAQVKAYIEQQHLLDGPQTVVAAVSGGIDSMVMADVLDRLRKELCFELVIVNFNHQLRPEAEEESRFVGAWAVAHGLHYFTGTADVARLAFNANTQDIARRERYAFLRSVANRMDSAVIATAHHQDDQAETLLIHLLRGSGTAGLAAMHPQENGIIRPLLLLTRAQINAYAQKNMIEYREDASNSCTKYLRNRIRLTLLPQLRTYNPHIVRSLAETAEICRAEDALLEELAENAFDELWDKEEKSLQAEGFIALSDALQRRVIRKAYMLMVGDTRELSFQQVEQVRALHDEQVCTLPRGVIAYQRCGLHFAESKPPLPLCEDEYPLIVDCHWHYIEALGFSYRVMPFNGEDFLRPDSFTLTEQQLADAVWRTRRTGDWCESTGKYRRKKLKELFIDAKIPAVRRNLWPLLAVKDQVLWVPGLTAPKKIAGENRILIINLLYDKI